MSTMVLSLTGCDKHDSYLIKPTGEVYAENDEIFKKGFATDNNGYAKYGEEVDRLTAVKPNSRQLDYLEMEYYNFIHFGMNTFTGKEWGTGKESPSKFNPTTIDTDQWCEVIKASGSKGVIFTAKHHDGFCLWQTNTTEHSIKNSPYQNGNGDVVKQLADSCKKYGLKLGLYLSPWDRNCSFFGTEKYNEYFKQQLAELLDGRYGDIFSMWFDGAIGEDLPDPSFKYDMQGWEELIHTLQPNCVTAIEGSDVRWVGNEAGVSRKNEWSVVSDGAEASLQFQNSENDAKRLQAVNYNDEDLGSRDLLKKYKNLIFKPAEVDVSIHKGWFYHSMQKPKSLEHLLEIYNKAVGGNSSLLLNLCPSKKGIIEKRDANRLIEFGEKISESKANPIEIASVEMGGYNNMRVLTVEEKQSICNESRDTELVFSDSDYILDFNFSKPTSVSRIDIRENLQYSQRVEAYDVYCKVDGGWELISSAGNVGNRRSLIIDKKYAPQTTAIRIVVRQSRNIPHLRFVGIYA